MAKRRGRPGRPYRPSWGGDPIHGLYKHKDGRWRIVATGEKFTEHDEYEAVQGFRRWEHEQGRSKIPFILPEAKLSTEEGETVWTAIERLDKRTDKTSPGPFDGQPTVYVQLEDGKYTVGSAVDEIAFWAKVRYFLTHDQVYMAKRPTTRP